MAVLIPPSARVETGAGDPISGGKLRIYEVNTTTLAATKSDEALTTPLANPVVADSNGFLPNIFLAEGTYDLQYLDAANVSLAGQGYTDWPTLDLGVANSFDRTLSGARINIVGGDIGDGTTGVLIRAGDPSPDVTGGNLGIWGWLSTQLDKLRINVNAFHVTGTLNVAGLITENAKKLMGVVQTEGSFTGATSVEITLPDTPVNVRGWMIEFIDLKTTAATSQSLSLQLSYDGTTYKSGASDYNWTVLQVNPAGATPGGATSGNDTLFNLTGSTSANIEPQSAFLRVEIYSPLTGSDYTNIIGYLTYTTTTNLAQRMAFTAGAGKGGYGRVQKVRLTASATNIAGRYRLIPLRGFGE